MRHFRIFIFVMSLVFADYLYAGPLRFDVKGTITAYSNHGSSPLIHGNLVSGWYELDWDNAKFGAHLPEGAIYTGILSYYFTIGNNLILSGSNSNTEYFSASSQLAPNSANMQFKDQSPHLANAGNFLPIEDVMFYVTSINGMHTAWFDYYSVPDFDHGNNVYSGWCNLAEVQTPEPASIFILLLGAAAIVLIRAQRN